MIILPEVLTIHNVEEVKEEVKKYLREEFNEKSLKIDFNNLQDIDAAGLQLLLSIMQIFIKQKVKLVLLNQNDYIKKLLCIVGCDILIEEEK